MINLEPSWQELGEIVCAFISESKTSSHQKAGLLKIVTDMASVAHYARAQQLKQMFRDGEIDSLPSWVEET